MSRSHRDCVAIQTCFPALDNQVDLKAFRCSPEEQQNPASATCSEEPPAGSAMKEPLGWTRPLVDKKRVSSGRRADSWRTSPGVLHEDKPSGLIVTDELKNSVPYQSRADFLFLSLP